MRLMIRDLTIVALATSLAAAAPAAAVPMTAPIVAAGQVSPAIPVNGLLCGRGWHWSYLYFKCERNRHRCPVGTHWISLIRTCVGL